MAPLPDIQPVRTYLSTLLSRTPTPTSSVGAFYNDLSPKAAGLVARAKSLVRRDINPGAGVTPPQKVPNKLIFILFGLIGVGFIVTGIWFFFWAKNGGFYFHENDWEEYKTTVLRRKRGPNGTTLSGVTESTDLGGGSVVHGEKSSKWRRLRRGRKGSQGTKYKDFDEEGTLTVSGGGSSLGSEMGEAKYNPIGEKKSKKTRSRKSRSEQGDEEVDASVRDELRAYRHEKAARVGGLNKESDASAFDGSTVDNSSAASELLSNREHTPTNTPTKVRKERKDTYTGGSGGIRKVVSTSSPGPSIWDRATGSSKNAQDTERIQAEARKLQEKGRAAVRRDFSFQVGDDGSSSGLGADEEEARARREARRESRRASRSPTKHVPGGYYEESVVGSDLSGDIGTKTYHHPIPGLTSSEYAEERRKRRTETRYRRDEL